MGLWKVLDSLRVDGGGWGGNNGAAVRWKRYSHVIITLTDIPNARGFYCDDIIRDSKRT
jgi:hypothetical protein